ncbi:MAG: hypothetical protein HZB38_04785 [Planctomycetes bacterium]|nr:hypothetical protein [Planctomycetota bacterium]
MLSVVFLGAGMLKVAAGPAATKIALLTVGISAPALVDVTAQAIPVFEILLGAWLAIGVRRRLALGVALLFLTAATTVLVSLGRISGWNAPCNCLGRSVGSPIYLAVIRNIVLLSIAFAVAVRLGVNRSSATRAET